MAREPDNNPPVRIPWIQPQPYGPWETVGYSIVICGIPYYLCFMLGQLAAMTGGFPSPDEEHFEDFLWDFLGRFALTRSLTQLLLASLGLLFLWIVVSLRGASPRVYFGRVWPVSWPALWQWAILPLVFAAAFGLRYWTKVPLGTWIRGFSATSPYPLILMIVAIVVANPLFEELLFRGFLYSGIARSRLGPWAAIIITTVAWASIHWQQGWIGLPDTVGLGIYLGWLRKRTECIGLPILVHMVWNGLALGTGAIAGGTTP